MTAPKRIDIITEREGAWIEGYAVEAGAKHPIFGAIKTGTPMLTVSHFWRDDPRYGSASILRPMTPATARALAAALVKMADQLEEGDPA